MIKIIYRIFTGISIILIAFFLFGYTSQNILLSFSGGVMIAIVAYMLQSKISVVKNGEYVDAVVVETIWEQVRIPKMGKADTFIPILRYEVNGQVHTVQYHIGNADPKYEDGEIVKIMYNRENVEKIVIVGDNTVYIFSVIFGIAGLAMFVGGLYMYFV